MFHIFVQVQEVEEIVFQLINLGEIKISSKKVLKHWHTSCKIISYLIFLLLKAGNPGHLFSFF